MKNTLKYTVVFLVVIFLLACGSTSLLKTFKNKHENKQYESIAKTEIKCNKSDKGCNQLHLIKGDACYRLGKENNKPLERFDCAIEHLDTGISLTKQWKSGQLDLNQDQVYENLSESLRLRQNMSKGAEADKFTRRLIQTSAAFLKLSPDNLAAIYFNNSANFTALRGRILTSPDDPRVCQAVDHILSRLLTASTRAANSRYASQYSVLIGDVKGIKAVLVNCP